MFCQRKYDRRHCEESGDAVFLNKRECLIEVETWKRDHRDAVCEQSVHQYLHAVDVEERKEGKRHLAIRLVDDCMVALADVCDQIVVGEHDALRQTSRAR